MQPGYHWPWNPWHGEQALCCNSGGLRRNLRWPMKCWFVTLFPPVSPDWGSLRHGTRLLCRWYSELRRDRQGARATGRGWLGVFSPFRGAPQGLRFFGAEMHCIAPSYVGFYLLKTFRLNNGITGQTESCKANPLSCDRLVVYYQHLSSCTVSLLTLVFICS